MRLKYGIAIAGMHGKTTTTSMVAAVLAAGGLDPTVVVGGRVDAMGSNARLGKSHYLVAEADESDRSFLKLSPILSVVTNIDREHMDCYRDMEDVERTYVEFMDRVPFYGMIVACNDNEPLRALLPRVQRRVVTYGTRADSDFRLTILERAATKGEPLSRFNVKFKERDLGEFHLRVPGDHNVLNATAAIAVGIGLEVPVEAIRAALDEFRGVDRRFQVKGTSGWSDGGRRLRSSSDGDSGDAGGCTTVRVQAGACHLPAAPIYANAIADGGIRDGVRRCGHGSGARHLCGERAADRGSDGRNTCCADRLRKWGECELQGVSRGSDQGCDGTCLKRRYGVDAGCGECFADGPQIVEALQTQETSTWCRTATVVIVSGRTRRFEIRWPDSKSLTL